VTPPSTRRKGDGKKLPFGVLVICFSDGGIDGCKQRNTFFEIKNVRPQKVAFRQADRDGLKMNLGPKKNYIPVTFPSIGSSPAENTIRIPQN
jgi:hypothetical protein